MSLESAPDRSYDVPPADERKGKTKAGGDHCLGTLIITHRSTLIRYRADTMAPPRQKNVASMNYWRAIGVWQLIRLIVADFRGGRPAIPGAYSTDDGKFSLLDIPVSPDICEHFWGCALAR
jgi:hypothetical protein